MSWFRRRPDEPAVEPADAFTTPQERALEAWRALEQHCLFWRDEALLAQEGPGRLAAGAPLWPLSQVMAAAIDVEAITGDRTAVDGLRRGLERYRVGAAYGPHPGARPRYYDDNCWIALDLLRWHDRTGDEQVRDEAERVFGFIAEGEAAEGGVYWVEQPKQSRHTCSTAPAVQVALDLRRVGGRADDLEAFARRADAFLDAHLRAPSGLYWDNIDDRGRVEPTHWSYNQGAPVRAKVLLAALTDDEAALELAEETARAALELYGDGDGWWRQPAAFNGVCFRDLLALHRIRPLAGLLDALDRYLERAWTSARHPRNGLLLGGGIGRYEGGGTIDHAALVQLYAVRAAIS